MIHFINKCSCGEVIAQCRCPGPKEVTEIPGGCAKCKSAKDRKDLLGDGPTFSPTRYVLGFLFRDDCTSVVLIRKEKPKWQEGLLNGVGGKIEPGETELQAMIREFREETGVNTTNSGWREFCEMSGEGFAVRCFTARDSDAWKQTTTVTPEQVETHDPDTLKDQDCVSNLHWLVELALDENHGKRFFATVRYAPPFHWQTPNVVESLSHGV